MACSGDRVNRNQQALTSLLKDIEVAVFDVSAAISYGPIRLVTRDRKRDVLDKLIAAHAVALDVVLVTNNEADFLGIRI